MRSRSWKASSSSPHRCERMAYGGIWYAMNSFRVVEVDVSRSRIMIVGEWIEY